MGILKLFGAILAVLVFGGLLSRHFDNDQDYSHFNKET